MSIKENNHEELEIIQDYIANKLHYVKQYEIEREMQKDLLLNDAIDGLSSVSEGEIKKSMTILQKEFSSDSKSKSTIAIVVAILILGAIAVGCYFFFQDKSSIESEKTTSPTTIPIEIKTDTTKQTDDQVKNQDKEVKPQQQIKEKLIETNVPIKKVDDKVVSAKPVVTPSETAINQSNQYTEADAFTIEGKIIDTKTKKGIEGVEVSIVRSNYKVESRSDGKYTFLTPPQDSTRHTLKFSKQNYTTVFAYPSSSGYTVVNMEKQNQ